MAGSDSQAPSAPLASVVMCAYNEQDHIAPAVASIMGQTFKEFELIVVDDASTDGTADILRGYRDPRIHVIRNERNSGIAMSRNLGTKAARARIIVVADADDICFPTRLEEQVRYLNDFPEVGAVGTYVNVIDAEGQTLGVIETPISDSEIKRAMGSRSAIVHGSLAVRKDLIQSIGGYREKFVAGSDYDLISRLSERCTMATIPRTLYSYRLTPKSISIRNREAQKSGIDLVKKFAKERSASGGDSYAALRADRLARIQEPEDEDSLLARYHLHAGQLAGSAGNMDLARSHFTRSISRDPFKVKPYLLTLLAWCGRGVYQACQRLFGTTEIALD